MRLEEVMDLDQIANIVEILGVFALVSGIVVGLIQVRTPTKIVRMVDSCHE